MEVEEKIRLTQEIQILNGKFERHCDLSWVYETNKDFFEQKLVESFTGFIPKDVSEPTLKIFEDHSELLQRWILWQSHFINKKSLHDQAHLEKYGGMMIYLKVLFLMAEQNKKRQPAIRKPIISEPEPSFLEKAMAGVDEFKEYGSKKD